MSPGSGCSVAGPLHLCQLEPVSAHFQFAQGMLTCFGKRTADGLRDGTTLMPYLYAFIERGVSDEEIGR